VPRAKNEEKQLCSGLRSCLAALASESQGESMENRAATHSFLHGSLKSSMAKQSEL
jgi:hypothetical protein